MKRLRQACKPSSASALALIAAVWPVDASRAQKMSEVELPPVVVEGATLEAKKPVRPKADRSAPTAGDSSTVKAASKKPSKQGAGSGSVSATPETTSTSAEPDEGNDSGGGSGSSGGTEGGVLASRIATPVSVVTGAELRARQVRNAADALRGLPGVTVSSAGGGGQLTQVRIRGAEANHTLVVIDGIEANDTNGGEFDFSNLAAEDIERIEVIRGVQSGLYGSRAIGGVINIVTRSGQGPLTVRARAEGGSFGTRDVAGGVSAGSARGYFSAGVNFTETDGFNIAPTGSEDDGMRRSTFNMRAGVAVVEGIRLDFSLRRTATLADYDAFDGPVGVLQTAQDAPNVSDAVLWLGGGKVTFEMLDGALTQVVGGNFNSSDVQSTDTFSTSTFANDRNRFYSLSTARFAMPEAGLRHTVSGLIESERETFRPDIAFFTDNQERERGRLAYAGEYRGEWFDRFFPIASIRHEDNDSFADFTTWRTGVSIGLTELGLRPHASLGTAVALPGMFEQFGAVLGSFIGNPNLVPEESRGWDVGVELTVWDGKAVIDVTYFSANLENEIVGFGNTIINLPGESTRQGIEVASRVALSPAVTLGAAYTWMDAADQSGLAEVRRPEHSAKFDVNYVFDRGRGALNLAAHYNGSAPDVGFLNLPPPVFFGSQRVTLDDYWLVNVAASYKVAPGVEVYGRVENLLDQDYQEVFGFETADLAAYAGVRFTYEEDSTRAWSQGR